MILIFFSEILEGNKIVLTNVSETDDGQYECIADNGINPPARESTKVTVECKSLNPYYNVKVECKSLNP